MTNVLHTARTKMSTSNQEVTGSTPVGGNSDIFSESPFLNVVHCLENFFLYYLDHGFYAMGFIILNELKIRQPSWIRLCS